MLQAIAALASLAVVALAIRIMAGSIVRELPALRQMIGVRPRVGRARIRRVPARRAEMLRLAAAPRRAAA